ncbi:MAG: hypothetical protein BTN85_2207 [Candidatus Methanohalarchaeum thermophilum]|uniref:Uncharacterized protein n=1 Tax=Methanohalarchaeum thermophilum TaxID=1903181 RepID=A0A1Q6DRT7_METT1|nr:MAG: hypothetical protein BTN85_2207 [Candidatus Methanohalarchaeum thermophilum]
MTHPKTKKQDQNQDQNQKPKTPNPTTLKEKHFSLIQTTQKLEHINPKKQKPLSNTQTLQKNSYIVIEKNKAINLIQNNIAKLIITNFSLKQYKTTQTIQNQEITIITPKNQPKQN